MGGWVGRVGGWRGGGGESVGREGGVGRWLVCLPLDPMLHAPPTCPPTRPPAPCVRAEAHGEEGEEEWEEEEDDEEDEEAKEGGGGAGASEAGAKALSAAAERALKDAGTKRPGRPRAAPLLLALPRSTPCTPRHPLTRPPTPQALRRGSGTRSGVWTGRWTRARRRGGAPTPSPAWTSRAMHRVRVFARAGGARGLWVLQH